MKKTIGIMGGIALCLLTLATSAQTEPAKPIDPATTKPVVETWDAKKNPAVTAITSQYEGKYIAPRPALTTADIFPVIGNYESATNMDAASVSIILDEQNKGVIWVAGIPQGKVKAMLRKSPAIYKIPAQKTEDGKEIAEGTLIFDKETNALHIVIGKPYKAEDPASVFAVPAIGDEVVLPETKTKVKEGKVKIKRKTPEAPKAWVYTGTKVVTETVSN